jgi:hypothetical protein
LGLILKDQPQAHWLWETIPTRIKPEQVYHGPLRAIIPSLLLLHIQSQCMEPSR